MTSPHVPGVVTALIPTFRRPSLLRRAVRSVLAQTWPESRASVFDNASGDETESVVAELARDGRVSYHRHPENIESGPNFVYALAHVPTPFFSILSDDDLLLPGFYAEAMAAFARHPEAGFVCLDVLEMNARGDLRPEVAMAAAPEGLYAVPDGLLAFVRHVPTSWAGVVFRREVLQEVVNIDLEVGTASDVDFLFRAAARYPFVLRHVPGAIFVPASIAEVRSWRGSVDGFWPGWGRMVDRLASDPRLPADVRSEVRLVLMARLRQYLGFVAAAAIVRGDFAEAKRAADLLERELGQPTAARFLHLAASSCARIPGVHHLVRGAFAARQWLRHVRHRTFGGRRSADLGPIAP